LGRSLAEPSGSVGGTLKNPALGSKGALGVAQKLLWAWPPATQVTGERGVCLGTAFLCGPAHHSVRTERARRRLWGGKQASPPGSGRDTPPLRDPGWARRGAGAELACGGRGGGGCPRPSPARRSVPGGRRQRLEGSPGFASRTSAAAPQAPRLW
jgi:hypothetical protein